MTSNSDDIVKAFVESTVSSMNDTAKLSASITDVLDDFDTQLSFLLRSLEPIQKATQGLMVEERELSSSLDGILAQEALFEEAAELIDEFQAVNSSYDTAALMKLKRAVEVISVLQEYSSSKDFVEFHMHLSQVAQRALKTVSTQMVTLFQASESPYVFPSTLPLPDTVTVFPPPVLEQMQLLAAPVAISDADKSWMTLVADTRKHVLRKLVGAVNTDPPSAKSKAYERGTLPLVIAIDYTLKVMTAERDTLRKIFGVGKDTSKADAIFRQAARAPVEELLAAVDSFVTAAKRTTTIAYMFPVFDVHTALDTTAASFIALFPDPAFAETIGNVKESVLSICRRAFSSFGDTYMAHLAKTVSTNASVHELTVNCISFLKQLAAYSDVVASILPSNRNATDGLRGFVKNVIELLRENLQAKADSTKPAALRALFLLNNHVYVLKKLQASDALPLVGDGFVSQERALIEKARSEVERATTGEIRAAISGAHAVCEQSAGTTEDRQALKKALQTFTAALEGVYNAQKRYVLSDSDVRVQLRQQIATLIVPEYTSLLVKVGETELPKDVVKYIKYRPNNVEELIHGLYSG
ncbi:Exocyst complex protein Exo70 [Carpediemonas membranifera]|uniref:Exocyst subunit Exo70 family protein n=1 Tax=Carpediemonas membranifera TaxID=201153 RepID=A0A8J6B541_9EUKA|nr:Exocyst complex protein Exo70 [Carpediemonas membranifera]|eukprot:KAG9393209.1 Exocyst complex protein Exo70 [Carpediemonas membranifera]